MGMNKVRRSNKKHAVGVTKDVIGRNDSNDN